MLADFLDLETAVTVTIHIQSIDQSEAIKRSNVSCPTSIK